MADGGVSGGGFSLNYVERGALLRLIAAWATIRSRLRHIHYGDQAPFVRRTVLDRIGGVPDVELFEDLELARAVKRAGRVVSLPLAVEHLGTPPAVRGRSRALHYTLPGSSCAMRSGGIPTI